MANSDLGISHLRFRNNKTASETEHTELLFWICTDHVCAETTTRKQPILDDVREVMTVEFTKKGQFKKKKKGSRMYFGTVSFYVAFALPSWVVMRINFSVKGDQTDTKKD